MPDASAHLAGPDDNNHNATLEEDEAECGAAIRDNDGTNNHFTPPRGISISVEAKGMAARGAATLVPWHVIDNILTVYTLWIDHIYFVDRSCAFLRG